MPHQCTNCGRTFPDGSKEMLSGCPDCGGNKFQFEPSGSTTDDEPAADSSADSSPDASTGESVTIDPEPAETASADRQTSPPETEGFGDDNEAGSAEPAAAAGESPAQSTARSDVVDSSEITAAGAMGPSTESSEASGAPDQPAGQSPPTADQPADGQPTDGQPAEQSTPAAEQSTSEGERSESNLDQLRKELNDQFESIRIVSPGQYELNLMELYDREEYIISLREDGRYVIEVPDSWGDS
ncbi:Zn-ribbon domain-containing protein [Halohasta salina]|uniref:Zn-ribbon domain-containing protein n=1 Tax=Halohasta salina TaxID=2961621 RepID=UPI0020A347C7|nr:Zn-ribbon domain-containing protein [Halohasta salina]